MRISQSHGTGHPDSIGVVVDFFFSLFLFLSFSICLFEINFAPQNTQLFRCTIGGKCWRKKRQLHRFTIQTIQRNVSTFYLLFCFAFVYFWEFTWKPNAFDSSQISLNNDSDCPSIIWKRAFVAPHILLCATAFSYQVGDGVYVERAPLSHISAILVGCQCVCHKYNRLNTHMRRQQCRCSVEIASLTVCACVCV